MLHELLNKKAPSFTLLSSEKHPISLKDFKNQFLVVYFYPKDETSGCTIEAQAFKNNFFQFQDLDINLIGISPDDPKRHCEFIEHYDLPFPLLSDLDHQAAVSFGVWVQKTMYGKTYWGIERTTFIIDKEGIIRDIIDHIKPNEHPEKALESVKKII